MKSISAVCVVLAGSLLQGCSSLNPFGGESSAPPAAAPVAAAEGGAAGQPAPSKRVPEGMALKRFDADTNGVVTRDELELALVADFKRDDVNANATLDTAELRAVNERLRQERNMSPVFDWNADGQLVYAEFATQWRTLFDRADRNGDNVVSYEEMEGRPERAPRPLPPPDRPGQDVGRTRIGS